MTIERREELISAYLDGELEPAERAEVEKWLAESPELRQLRDELVALGGSMRSLARHKLDRDLGRTVLQRAERSVLGGDTAAQAAPDVRPSLSISDWWSRGAGWRRLAWPAVAVAAALVMMIVNSDERAPERQVALAPKGETAIAAREAAPGGGKPSAVEARVTHSADKSSYRGRQVAKSERADDKPELMLKTAPGSAPAAAPAAAGTSYLADTARSASPAQQAAGVRVIVCDVTPEYLKDKSFEKLLDKLKVKLVSEELSLSRPLAAAKEAKDRGESAADEQLGRLVAPGGLRQTYTVEATGQQIDQVIAAMPNESKPVKKLNELPARAKNSLAVDAASDVATRYRFVLQAPAAETAVPTEGEDKP
jgi:hypothetical protein